MPIKKSLLRGAVPSILRDSGYAVVARSSQGHLPGSRLLATKEGEEHDVAVKVLLDRRMNFTKQSATEWRTLGAVDLVVAVAPSADDDDVFEILAFEAAGLIACFNEAWKALKKANRALSFEMPIFVPLDDVSRKKVGHDVANLKELAKPLARLSLEDIKARSLAAAPDTFIERVKREFAERNEVDVSKVVVEFRILS